MARTTSGRDDETFKVDKKGRVKVDQELLKTLLESSFGSSRFQSLGIPKKNAWPGSELDFKGFELFQRRAVWKKWSAEFKAHLRTCRVDPSFFWDTLRFFGGKEIQEVVVQLALEEDDIGTFEDKWLMIDNHFSAFGDPKAEQTKFRAMSQKASQTVSEFIDGLFKQLVFTEWSSKEKDDQMRVALMDRSHYHGELSAFYKVFRTMSGTEPELSQIQGLMLQWEAGKSVEKAKTQPIDKKKTAKRVLELDQASSDEEILMVENRKKYKQDYGAGSSGGKADWTRNRDYSSNSRSRFGSDRKSYGGTSATKCFRCDSTRHKESECPFRSRACYECREFGHPARKCTKVKPMKTDDEMMPKMDQDDESKGGFGAVTQQQQSKEIQAGGDSIGKKDIALAPIDLENNEVALIVKKKDPRLVKLQVCQVKYVGKNDSGADVNTVPYRLFQEMAKESSYEMGDINSDEDQIRLKTYGGDAINVVCSFMASIKTVEFLKPCVTARIFVVDEPVGRKLTPLLSMSTSTKMNLLRVGERVTSSEISNECITEQLELVMTAEPPIIKFPCIPMKPVELIIDTNAIGNRAIYNKISKAYEKPVELYFENLEALGVIEPMRGECKFLSRVEVVPKDKGADFRVVIDLRKANLAVKRHLYPMPNRDHLLAKLFGSKIFTKLDLKDAFHHVPIHENSRDVFGFMTTKGPRRFTRLPFGASIAPEVFQKVMDEVFEGCDGVLVYLDDILIFAKDLKTLRKRQAKVLKRVVENNLTLNARKCEYEVKSVKFVGALISEDGIDPDGDKIKAIQKFERPKTIMQMRGFLGLVTYIAPHIEDLAIETEPLRKLVRDRPCSKHSEFKVCKFCWKSNGKIDDLWTEDQETAFLQLKSIAQNNIIRRGHFDSNVDSKVSLCVDASPVGLAAILKQLRDEGIDVVIACASRSLSVIEQRYPQTQREALALVWGVEKFYYYLLGRKFTVVTDHSALRFIFGDSITSKSRRALTRAEGWALRLSAYDFDVVSVPAIENVPADALSRGIGFTAQSHGDMEEEKNGMPGCESFTAEMNLNQSSESGLGFKLSVLKEIVHEDLELSAVRKAMETGNWSPEIRNYMAVQNDLRWVNGVMTFNGKLVIPAVLRNVALNKAHGSHEKEPAMKFALRKSVWWPEMSLRVHEFVKNCSMCQQIDEMFKAKRGAAVTDQTEASSANILMLEASTALDTVSLSAKEVKAAQIMDDEIGKVKSAMEEDNWPKELSGFQIFKKQLRIVDELLLRKKMIVLPEPLRAKALSIAHVAHSGMSTMKRLLRKSFWWPKIDRDVETWVKSCHSCVMFSQKQKPTPLVSAKMPSEPWTSVAIDFFSKPEMNQKVLVVVDYCSRFLAVARTNSEGAGDTIKSLNGIFRTFGWPKTIKSDNAKHSYPANTCNGVSLMQLSRCIHRRVSLKTTAWQKDRCRE